MNAQQPDTAPPAAKLVQTAPAPRPDPALPDFEHRFATAGGVRLHCVTGGMESGEARKQHIGARPSIFPGKDVNP